MQRVCVRATSYEQLKGLGDRLSGVPPAAALELELSFSRKENLNLGTVKTFFRRAGLTERVRAVKYSCKRVLGTHLSPGSETPVSAELWPSSKPILPSSFWHNIFQHSLVELQITVRFPEYALKGIKAALRCGERICGTLRSLQVDRYNRQYSLPLFAITEFLAGLKLPCLSHLGFNAGVTGAFQGVCAYPQKEDLPLLQSFGGSRNPDGIFGLGKSSVHVAFVGPHYYASMAPNMAQLAASALGAGIKELHMTVSESGRTWEGPPLEFTRPSLSVLGFLALLSSLQQLSIKALTGQVLVKAEAINAITGLQTLALGAVTLEGDLTGPRLTQMVCLHNRTHYGGSSVLARPPPALTTVLVPGMLAAEVSQDVLGIEVPSMTKVVRACPGGPLWKVSSEACELWDWCSPNEGPIYGLVKAVRCRE